MNFTGHSGRNWSYDPKKQLGRAGGFGAVYLGSSQDGDVVAVKVIRSLGEDELAQRLQERELEIIAKLDQVQAPNLLKYLDVARYQKKILLVMELATTSLADRLPVDEGKAVVILSEIAAGLVELHQLGIIHRDLKPANTLLVKNVWKLADFGIAHDQSIGTQTATFKGAGTLSYMAPELFGLVSATVKSDLYALGCLAFELLNGSPPFQGPSVDDFRQQHETEIPPELDIQNPMLSELVHRLLQKEPSKRPQDARAVLERLGRMTTALTPIQRQLAELAKKNATLKAQEDSALAAELAAKKRFDDLKSQALADFETQLRDGIEEIRTVIPEVQLVGEEGRFAIQGPDATLSFRVWPSDEPRVADQDPMIVAGEVVATNWKSQGVWLFANVVAELREERVAWSVYRFTRSAFVEEYGLGPPDRDHGFNESTFAEERVYMIRSAMHIWTKKVVDLDGEILMQLFSEAMELALG